MLKDCPVAIPALAGRDKPPVAYRSEPLAHTAEGALPSVSSPPPSEVTLSAVPLSGWVPASGTSDVDGVPPHAEMARAAVSTTAEEGNAG
jgi:hypothetical protein